MKTHYCHVCNWFGMFPEYIRTEKKDGIASIRKEIPVCPVCWNEIRLKDIK